MNLPRRLPPAPLRAPWLVLLAPLLAWSAVRGLWAPDEPRYAEIAREIFERKSFLVLHLCGAVYPDKPPLFYWLSGLVGWLSGWSVAAMRLVPLAATIGTALLTARLARRWWGSARPSSRPSSCWRR